LNEIRLAVLSVLVAIGLGSAALSSGPVWVKVIVGTGAFVFASAAIKWHRSQHWLMLYVRWLTGS
jgi:hypothetical protein